jgi:hypothetical protein
LFGDLVRGWASKNVWVQKESLAGCSSENWGAQKNTHGENMLSLYATIGILQNYSMTRNLKLIRFEMFMSLIV